MRFNIRWCNEGDNDGGYVGYKVSIPQYDGGKVVTIEEVEEIENALEAAKEKLIAAERNILRLKEELRDLKGFS